MSDSAYLIDHLCLALATDHAHASAVRGRAPLSIDEGLFLDTAIRDGSAVSDVEPAPWAQAMRTRPQLAQAEMHDDDPRLLDLCRGLSFDEFHPVFQSVVRLADARTVGAEALARWAHPVHGTVLPEAFVPIADRSGLLAALGSRILSGACARLAAWQQVGHADAWVSVNLTARQLASPRLREEVAEAIARYDLTPGSLMLEVAEGTVASLGDAAAPLMRALRETGAWIAIDNLGTGGLTLAQIAALPLDQVKIDRSVVARLPESVTDQTRVRALLTLCERTGLLAIGEGVELEVERDVLSSLGCPLAQGFLFSTPTRSPDFDW